MTQKNDIGAALIERFRHVITHAAISVGKFVNAE